MCAAGVTDCQKRLRRIFRVSGKQSQIVFDRGVYVDENTSQAASVEFVRRMRTNYARSRLQKNWRKSPKGFFDKLKPPLHNVCSGGYSQKVRRGICRA